MFNLEHLENQNYLTILPSGLRCVYIFNYEENTKRARLFA